MLEADHGEYLEVYGTAQQAAALSQRGPRPQARRARPTRSPSQSADVPSAATRDYDVWRRYDRVAGDNKEQFLELYDRLEGMSIVKKVILGKTRMNRDIVALKVTEKAKTRTDDTRPAVLYDAMQHAREWLAARPTSAR